MNETQQSRAARFRDMHGGGRILVLPNAWDAGSARIYEQAGFRAVATTSAGIALSHGCPDGERLRREEMLEAVGRIVRAVSVPVTADLEAGYGATPQAVAETARLAMEAGAVGMNLEDSSPRDGQLCPVEAMVERIGAIRRVAEERRLAFVINARTDVYLNAIGEPAGRLDHAIRRANAYRAAGADCLFVPGVTDAATIGRLVGAIQGPVNILAGRGAPATAELERLGVARLSVGSGPVRAAYSHLRRLAVELGERGTYALFTEDTVPLKDFNQLFASGQASR
jgi:2-methylisocitrate lyase-like PEP mutase family enzyme